MPLILRLSMDASAILIGTICFAVSLIIQGFINGMFGYDYFEVLFGGPILYGCVGFAIMVITIGAFELFLFLSSIGHQNRAADWSIAMVVFAIALAFCMFAPIYMIAASHTCLGFPMPWISLTGTKYLSVPFLPSALINAVFAIFLGFIAGSISSTMRNIRYAKENSATQALPS